MPIRPSKDRTRNLSQFCLFPHLNFCGEAQAQTARGGLTTMIERQNDKQREAYRREKSEGDKAINQPKVHALRGSLGPTFLRDDLLGTRSIHI